MQPLRTTIKKLKALLVKSSVAVYSGVWVLLSFADAGTADAAADAADADDAAAVFGCSWCLQRERERGRAEEQWYNATLKCTTMNWKE